MSVCARTCLGQTITRAGGLSRLAAVLCAALASFGASASGQDVSPVEGGTGQQASAPNIVMVVVDDAALMDLGAFGGEARTPHIDALAKRGALFRQYRTSPLCAPSRAMLLTGLDSHLTGVATIPEVIPREHEGLPGYGLSLAAGVKTVASRLRERGYRTVLSGKWHLGHGPGELPADHGFDRSLTLDASGADNWEPRPYMPYYRRADWFEGHKRADMPDEFYSSELLVDYLIGALDAGAQETPDAPFFAYLAFLAIHIPIQAPREVTARYAGVYDAGWDVLRQARWERAQTLGLIGPDAALAPAPEGLRAWSSLTDDARALYAKSMAVNAAMLEAMDSQLGRLIAHLEATGDLANTLFVVTSDNGPEPSHPVGEPGFRPWMWLQGYTWDVETLGEKGSYAFIGPEWAHAAAAPSDLFKFYTAEGGVRAPLIVSGPGVASGAQIDAFAHAPDVAATVLDLAGVTVAPGEITGRSLRPVLEGSQATVYAAGEPVGMEVSGNAALYLDGWKLVRNLAPWGDGAWRLFDLTTDPGETRDLSAQEPERLARMHAAYADYAARVGVLEPPAGYDVTQQIARNAIAKQLQYYGWILALAALALGGVALMLFRFARRSAPPTPRS